MEKVAIFNDDFLKFSNRKAFCIVCDICDSLGNVSFGLKYTSSKSDLIYEIKAFKYIKGMKEDIILKIKEDYQNQLNSCLKGNKGVYIIAFKHNSKLFKELIKDL